jgi:hypothetical protein
MVTNPVLAILHRSSWRFMANNNPFAIGPNGSIWAGNAVPGSFTVGNIGPMIPGSVLTSAAQAYVPNTTYTFAATSVASPFVTAETGLTLTGNADIKFGNVSLKDFMEKVSLRLNMMVPNPELERQWDELRTLGEAYRAVEKECMDKAKVWDILKRDN